MRSDFRNVDMYQMAYLDAMARSTDQQIIVATFMFFVQEVEVIGITIAEISQFSNLSFIAQLSKYILIVEVIRTLAD